MDQKTRLLAMASLAAVSNLVWAQAAAPSTSCESVVLNFNSCSTSFSPSFSSPAACQAFFQENHPECFTTSNKSSTSAQIAATSVQQITTISTAVSGRLLALGFRGPADQKLGAASGVTGLAAAGNTKPYGIWGNIGQARTAYDGDSGVNNADKFSSTVTNTVFGLDYGFAADKIAGVSVALDHGNGSLGVSAAGTTTSGLSIAPYFGWQLNKTLALDASLGWGDGKFTSAGTNKSDTKRTFYAVNLSYAEWRGNLQLQGKAGYLVAKENYGDQVQNGASLANTSSSNTLSQFRIGGEVGYWMNNGTMPFLGLAYLSEDRSGSNAAGLANNSKLGTSAFLASLGVNFFSLSSGVTGGVLYTQELSRSNGKNNGLSANVSMKF